MEFLKYQHIERFGSDETTGIDEGTCYIFPKIDGTNGSIWMDNGVIKAGSRNRELTLDNDNAGFYAWVLQQDNIKQFLKDNQFMRLYGEWLCLSGDTIIRKTSGGKNSNYMTIREMYKYSQKKIVDNQKWTNRNGVKKTKMIERKESWWDKNGFPSLFSLYQDEDIIKPNKMKSIIYTGDKQVYEITTRKGYKIKCSKDHPFFTPNGFKQLKELKINDCVAISDLSNKGKKKRSYGKGTNTIFTNQNKYKSKIGKCEICGLDRCLELHHKDGDHQNNNENNYQVLCRDCHKKQTPSMFCGNKYTYEFDKIISITDIGVEDCYDISMEGLENEANFVAQGFIVHNCPHTLKTYEDSAWRKFYIFDVLCEKSLSDDAVLLSYDVYSGLCEKYGLTVIDPLCTVKNPLVDKLIELLDKNTYLIKDGQGAGEGIVIKNYNYVNKYGRQTWAKIVRNEFKTQNKKAFGIPEINQTAQIEEKIVIEFCTESLIEKEYAKIVTESDGWKSQYIPKLFGTVYYCLIVEEIWNIVKKYKNPTIDFSTMIKWVNRRVKEVKPELF